MMQHVHAAAEHSRPTVVVWLLVGGIDFEDHRLQIQILR